MCKENCKCNEQIEAVRRKIERMTEKALDRLESVAGQTEVDVKAQTEAINKKLFDGITKDELVACIVTDYDVLDFSGLLAREDVQTAISESEKLRTDAFNNAFEIGGKIYACEMAINELAQEIMDDVIIFGVTEKTQLQLASFDKKVDEILQTVE